MAAAPGMPYSATNPAILESTATVFNPNASDAEIPLTAAAQSFGRPSYQQWDGQGRAVYAPQPHRATPQRQLTGEGYPMSERPPPQQQQQPYARQQQQQRTSPLPPGAGYPYPQSYSGAGSGYQDPFSDSARVQPQQAVSYQRQAPPRGYGSPPPEAFSRQNPPQAQTHRPSQSQAAQPQYRRGGSSPPPPALRPPPASAPGTPTQGAYFQAARDAPPIPSAPPALAIEDPFGDPQPMPNPYEKSGHAAEATDATFYTAHGGHSRDVSAEDAYESSAVHTTDPVVREKGAPPAYF